MKTTPRFQQLLVQIAQQHGVDLCVAGAYLRLVMEESDHCLVMENLGGSRVSVALYLENNGNLVADPEVIFYLGDTEFVPDELEMPEWTPIERVQLFGGWELYMEVDTNGNVLESFDPRGQADLASFVEEVFVQDLMRQGWQERGRRSVRPKPSLTAEQMWARGIHLDGDGMCLIGE
jgi:Domain of unknown function (DUF6908)